MLDGIDIEFYSPDKREEVMTGKHFIKDDGNFIEFANTKKYSYFKAIPILFAHSASNEEAYSLVSCVFKPATFFILAIALVNYTKD